MKTLQFVANFVRASINLECQKGHLEAKFEKYSIANVFLIVIVYCKNLN